MKINEVIMIQNFISGLKLGKFSKDVRIAIIKNFTTFKKVLKESEDHINELREKTFEEFKEVIPEVQKLRNDYEAAKTDEEKEEIAKNSEKYNDFFKAESDFSQIYNDEMNKDVEIEVAKVDKDEFIEGMSESDAEFTVVDLDRLSAIFNE